MKTIHVSIKIAALILAAISFSTASTRANGFDWENLESDIAGVAEHVDPNLINPWGMALSPFGTIFVNDNGTGVATAYFQDGTPAPSKNNPLVVTIPPSATNTGTASPTGIVSNTT